MITSPAHGDRYEIPPGIEPRFATIRLAATGDTVVRWLVDGRPHQGDRWPLRSGTHEIRALAASGQTTSVTIHVR